jgi:hypothetical protein
VSTKFSVENNSANQHTSNLDTSIRKILTSVHQALGTARRLVR